MDYIKKTKYKIKVNKLIQFDKQYICMNECDPLIII